jgi:hypothetical protein
MLDIGVLTTGLEVLLVDLNVHAQDIPTEPVQHLHLHLNKRRSNRTTGGETSGTGISHKRTGRRGNRGSGLPLHISLLELMIHIMILTQILSHNSVINKKMNVWSIWHSSPGYHGIKNLMKNVVHDINGEILSLITILSTLTR